MSELRVATRYATSLFNLSQEKNSLDKIVEDARNFTQIVNENRGFKNMLSSPIVTTDKKMAVINKIFGNSFDPMTMAFIKIVLRKKREIVLPQIFEGVNEMYNKNKGVVSATVYTAVPVSEKIKADIMAFLEKETKRTVDLKLAVKEDILGGFVIKYEDKLVDASVATQLRSLRKHLINHN
jgi:F-type H+-transporting ATPase subunit delta